LQQQSQRFQNIGLIVGDQNPLLPIDHVAQARCDGYGEGTLRWQGLETACRDGRSAANAYPCGWWAMAIHGRRWVRLSAGGTAAPRPDTQSIRNSPCTVTVISFRRVDVLCTPYPETSVE